MSEEQQQGTRNTATAVGHAVAGFLTRFGKAETKDTEKPQVNLMPQVRFGFTPKLDSAKNTTTAGSIAGCLLMN